MLKIENPKINNITLNDEYDMNEVKEKTKDLNCIYLLGDCAGAGKTYMATKLNDRTLFVSPFNAQCQELQLKGVDSITYHKLFGLSVKNEIENTNKIDLADYGCICFDEIGLHNFRELTNIYRFINDHSDKLIICTGDSDQNTPFTHKLNNYEDNMKEYLITCRNIIFPNQITLHINKRAKNDDEKEKNEKTKRRYI